MTTASWIPLLKETTWLFIFTLKRTRSDNRRSRGLRRPWVLWLASKRKVLWRFIFVQHVWLNGCSCRYRKNLKNLLIVHPTMWMKMVFWVITPFVSSKFWQKLVYIDKLQVWKQTESLDSIVNVPPPRSRLWSDMYRLNWWKSQNLLKSECYYHSHFFISELTLQFLFLSFCWNQTRREAMGHTCPNHKKRRFSLICPTCYCYRSNIKNKQQTAVFNSTFFRTNNWRAAGMFPNNLSKRQMGWDG